MDANYRWGREKTQKSIAHAESSLAGFEAHAGMDECLLRNLAIEEDL